MNNAVLYFLSMIPDVFFIGGAAYLVQVHGWNPWWMLAGVILAGASFPYKFINEAKP